MEISPIVGIVSLPVIKAPPPDIGLVVMSDVENTARIGDETYTPSGGESAGGGEDDAADPVEEDEPEPKVRAQDDDPGSQVSFFA